MKVLFSDFDGTLALSNKLKNKGDKNAIETLKKQGHQFVICTGRCIHEVKRDVPQLDIPFDYMILNNGSHIIDHNFNTIYEKTIKGDVGKAILDELMNHEEMDVYFCDDQASYGKVKDVIYNQATGKTVDIDYVKTYKASPHFQILCFVQNDKGIDASLPLIDKLKAQYEGEVEIYLNTYFVDIVPSGCSKGQGINLFKKMINNDIETYAIGDSYNDLSMLEISDHGYTFKDVDISSQINNQVDSIEELIYKMLGE